MPKLMGALPLLTRYITAVVAAGLLLSAPSVAHADDATRAPMPSVAATESAIASSADAPAAAPPYSPDLGDASVESAESIHFGGM